MHHAPLTFLTNTIKVVDFSACPPSSKITHQRDIFPFFVFSRNGVLKTPSIALKTHRQLEDIWLFWFFMILVIVCSVFLCAKGGIGLGMFFSWKKGSGSFYPKACSSMTETSRHHHALSMVNGNLRVPPQCYPEGNRPYQEVNYGMINDQTSCAQLKLWTIDILSLSRLRMRELGFPDPKWLALWLSTHLPFLPTKANSWSRSWHLIGSIHPTLMVDFSASSSRFCTGT